MEQAGAGLQKIVAEALRKAAPEEAPLLAWPMVCGARLAEKTRALDFSGGVLRVEVPDAAWATQLLVFVPRYLANLNRLTGGGVQRIQFVLAGDAARAAGANGGR
jgi:predicted nucleic acid-binding Zn ribbon protein